MKKFKLSIDRFNKIQYTYFRHKTWAHSSAGRASALQAGGHRFEPYCAHHFFWPGSSVGQNASLSRQRSSVRARSGSPLLRYAFVAQLVEQRTENPRVVGSIPTEGTILRMQLIWQSATLPRWRQRVRASSSAP